jgi:uncharacterized protein YqgC (DUF456 family)
LETVETMDAAWWWTIVVGVAMVVGLCGVVIPVLPGLLVMWAGALLYGFAVGWSTTGVAMMVLATVAVAASFVAGVVIPRRTAAAAGASGWAQVAGLFGAVIGFFVIPVVGLIIGALAGVMAVEVARKGDWGEAWAATVGTAKGFGWSVLVDLGLGLFILLAWAAWAATVVR